MQRLANIYVLTIGLGVFMIAIGIVVGFAVSELGWVVAALGVSTLVTSVRGHRRLRAKLAGVSDQES